MAADVIAIVPAGGRSRRMGPLVGPGGKAALAVGGRSMLARVCDALATEAGRVIVVAAAGQPLPPLPATVEVIRDARPDAGPLVAFHAGLAFAGAGPRLAVLAACDLPDVEPAVVRMLVAAGREPGVRWVVPHVGGHPQVMLSALATDLAGEIAAAVAAGVSSPRALLERLVAATPAAVRLIPASTLATVDPRLASFADIDRPADLAGLDAGGIPPS